MTGGFAGFAAKLRELAKEFEGRGVALKVEYDPDSDSVRVYGEGVSALSRARAGVADASELAYATAEHHPLWGLLYHSSEIASTALERWRGGLTEEDRKEIGWAIRELEHALARAPRQGRG